jgi:hypothetical protein
MAKIEDDYELIDTKRKSAMLSAATVLESISKAKSLRKRWESVVGQDEPSVPENPKTDWLFDVLRLHTTYLNEAAKLGERYGTLAFRALERLYQTAVPNSSSIVLTETSPSAVFTVENDATPTAGARSTTIILDVPNVKGPPYGRISMRRDDTPIDLQPYEEGLRRRGSFQLGVGKPQTVTVAFEFNGFRRIRLEDELRVLLALDATTNRVRRIPLLIDHSRRPPEQR